jgi:hypothetical protein
MDRFYDAYGGSGYQSLSSKPIQQNFIPSRVFKICASFAGEIIYL